MNSDFKESDLDIFIVKHMGQHLMIYDNGIGSFFVNSSNSKHYVLLLPGCFIREQSCELLIELQHLARHSAVLFGKFNQKRIIQYPARTAYFSRCF